MQEIIDEADIGRSTFYAHFETKDDLLRSMCTDIFHHVFTEELPQEADEDCSTGCKNMELKLGHVLYHLRENKVNLKGLLASESGELFLSFLKVTFVRCLKDTLGNFTCVSRRITCCIIWQVVSPRPLNGG